MLGEVEIQRGGVKLLGYMSGVLRPKAWVIFAHGSGSSRKSARNQAVSRELMRRGYGVLLFDLLTYEEDQIYENRFNIPLLARRLLLVTEWLMETDAYKGEPFAYFGASTGAGAALLAAAQAHGNWPLFTVISRGGRPDLAGQDSLRAIAIPVLLIVGGRDQEVIKLNQFAANQLRNSKLSLVEGATHLFEEPGTLDEVSRMAQDWLDTHLNGNKQKSTSSSRGKMFRGVEFK